MAMAINIAFAQKAGYPDVFGQGLFVAGVLSAMVADWLGPANLTRFGVRYVGQVWPGDVLVPSGSVREVKMEDNTRVVACDLSVHRVAATGQRELVLKGHAQARYGQSAGEKK